MVKGDLLEILALWPEEAQDSKLKSRLALSCLQLLVPLTWPPELEDDKTTVNHHRHLPYLQLAQVGYKRAVLHYEHASVLRTAVRIALPSMAQPRRERSKRDEGIIKLVLYLFRNMAMITQPQMLPSQGDENEISRSATINAFTEQDVFNLMLTVGSGANDEFQDQDVILLEILFHLLKGVDARKLFMEQHEVQHQETNELRSLMQKEKAMHKSYNRHAPSRHNRFGTMLWVKRDDEKMSTLTGQASIVDGDATLLMMDKSKKWNKPRFRGKQSQQPSEQADFGERTDLTERARKHLRSFVEDFLDSSFNPLFSSLRKAIERETDRVGEVHKRQYFYLISWFLRAESARHSQRSADSNHDDNTFAYIAAVLDQETFVLLNRNMQRAFDEKSWLDLQATLLAFTQILLTIQNMAESNDEEDQEIAENIQNRIFYEEATHDRILQVLRGYANQGFAYLDTVTECVHVFVRMLERYSKQNADLHIRSKRRSRRKANKDASNAAEDEDAADEERLAQATVSERKFDFARFSAKFLSQSCVDTFLSLLHFYADLTPEQLKRCHRYLYRLAFKHELSILLFRVDVLSLLHRMIKGPGGLSAEGEGFKDWEQLVQQVFRRCFKWMQKSNEDGWKETCVAEMLFSKVANTLFYLQNGYERVVEKRPPRPPAELEFKAAVEAGMKLPVAVSLLLEQSKGDALDWVKKELQRAITERTAWEMERAAKSVAERTAEDGEYPDEGIEPSPPSIFLGPDTNERKMQLFKDKHLRLLLGSIGFERLGLAEDIDASWVIPSEVATNELRSALDTIKKTEFDPPNFEEGKTAKDMLRNKSAARRGEANTYDSASEDGGSGSELDESLFPPNIREKQTQDSESWRDGLTKRNAKELTEEELNERAAERQRKEKERNGKIKSQLYVTAGDDESDVEADEEFFRLERERHAKMQGVIGKVLEKQIDGSGSEPVANRKASKKQHAAATKTKRKRKQAESDDEGSELEVLSSGSAKRKRSKPRIFEEDSENEHADSDVEVGQRTRLPSESASDGDDGESTEKETPSTSPPPGESVGSAPLKELSNNVGGAKLGVTLAGAEDDEDDEDAPIVKPVARRNIRAGFIIDSDSE